jgi:hypothetical protein
MSNCSWTSERVGLKLYISPEVKPQMGKVFRERNQVKLHSAHYDLITRIKALLYTLCVCNVS